MNVFLFSIIVIFLSLLMIFLCNKNSFLMSQAGDAHQEFSSHSNIPLIGGMIIFFSLSILNFFEFNVIFIYLMAMFIVGFLSDLKKLISPIFRLLLQIVLIILFVHSSDINLTSTGIFFLDHLLNNYLFSIFFTAFCILVIINGSNFIDGVNSLAIGYYIIISMVLLLLKNDGFIVTFNFPLHLITVCLIILYFFNLFNKLYLGDSGAYLLGFIFSIELINFFLQNNNVSPYFIILLLWYPAFENLFSILRKTNFKKSPILPDTNHLHQLIFSYLKKKHSSFKANNITGISINIYNGVIMMIALSNPSYTQLQIILIIVNLSVYTFFYMRLFNYR